MKEIQILNNGDALYDIRRKINENFELLQHEVTADPLASFGINEGNETDGVADLLTVTDGTLSFKVGGEYPNLVATSGDGVTTQIESINPLHLQNLADGEYKVVVDGSNSNITDAEFYSQLLEPENADFGDVWFNGENATTLTRGAINVKLQPNTNFSPSFFVTNGNTYLAGGQGYRILRSIDGGATWGLITYDSEADNNVLVGGTYHNGAFYLVGTNKRIYKTETSAGWSFESLTTQSVNITKFKKLTNNFFVVLTTQGTFFYSTDMVNWNFYSTLAGKNIIDMVYFNGKYYAFLATGEIYTSTDISNWEIIQTTIASPACAFIYKDYILVGNQTGGITIYDPINNTTEMRQLHNPGKINHFHLRNDGGLLILGSYNICCVTYDLQEFTQLYETGGTLTYGDDDFIIGSSGFLLKTMVANEWVPYPYIPVGEVTISGGEVTYFTTYPYNSNGLHEASSSTFGLLRTAAVTDEMDCTCNDAVITPANLYDLSNYRMANTEYELDAKVGCPYHHNLQLKCVQPGTTSNEALDTKGTLEPGTELEDGTVIWQVEELGTGGGSSLPMFTPIWSDHLLKDVSYLRADNFSWHDGKLYSTGYKDLLKEFEDEACVEEVENGVTFRRTPGGFKIATPDQQDNIIQAYENNGIAWYYVLDTENKRFKLPRTQYGFTGLRDTVGNNVEAGLPTLTTDIEAGHTHTRGTMNITGDLTYRYGAVAGTGSGAISMTNKQSVQCSTNSGSSYVQLHFDASKSWEGETSREGEHSHTIEGTADTVQPPATQMYLYFYVGNYPREEVEVNVGELTEAVNNKVDLDGGNFKGSELETYIHKHSMNDKRTNCLLEVPQRVKYTLDNGTLTIHAGTVCIVPYGTENLTSEFPVGSTFLNDNFKVYDTQYADGKFFVWAEVQGDLSNTSTIGETHFFGIRPSGVNLSGRPVSKSVSGAGVTTTNGYAYDTTSNIVNFYDTNGVLQDTNCTLPLLVANPQLASIDQVFNSIGYIGSTVWVDKGVKGLIPNGRNEDGTLRNIEFTTDKVIKREVELGTSQNVRIFYNYNSSIIGFSGNEEFEFNEEKNMWVYTPTGVYLPMILLGTSTSTSNAISNFNPKQPFRAVDYSDKAEVAGWSFPSNKYIDLTLGASGSTYTAPANGWYTIHKNNGASNASLNFRTYINGTELYTSGVVGGTSTDGKRILYPAKKGDVVEVNYNATGATNYFRFIYAQGEV